MEGREWIGIVINHIIVITDLDMDTLIWTVIQKRRLNHRSHNKKIYSVIPSKFL